MAAMSASGPVPCLVRLERQVTGVLSASGAAEPDRTGSREAVICSVCHLRDALLLQRFDDEQPAVRYGAREFRHDKRTKVRIEGISENAGSGKRYKLGQSLGHLQCTDRP
jgi:hypothetical protein